MSDADIDMVTERGAMLLEQRLRAIKASMRKEPDAQPTKDCEVCEEPIPPQRLSAVPWTTRCVHCQGSAERR